MYCETTKSIRVAVEPFFIEEHSKPEDERWVFGYHVTIENLGDDPVQLMSRHWRIVDARGRLIEVRGEGVLGEQPVLEPGVPYSYTSGTPLPTPSAIMSGTYQVLGADRLWFDVVIPAFSLDAPGSRGNVH